ncbi:hypothetical protein FXO38_04407 [Capsicum annuum]|nr:hypothetical protein FXO38_04407 [Capsicum annuum]
MLVSKIPALVDSLIAKTRSWEQDRNTTFTYDGVPLLAMLDEYMMLRHDREEEKRRLRDQKKFREQIKESETPFGSTHQPLLDRLVNSGDGKRDHSRIVAPVNYVALSKDDATSHVSGTEHIPSTP